MKITGMTEITLGSLGMGKGQLTCHSHWDAVTGDATCDLYLVDVRHVFSIDGAVQGVARPQDLEPWLAEALDDEILRDVSKQSGTVLDVTCRPAH